MAKLNQMGFEELDDLRDRFNREEIEKFRADFALFDTDGDGVVTEAEGVRALRACGLCKSRKQLIGALNELSPCRFGKVTFSQFITILALHLKKKEPYDEAEELKQAFMVFDRENTGFMSVGDFRNVISNLGEEMTQKESDHMVKDADMKGEGFVDIKAFVDLMVNTTPS